MAVLRSEEACYNKIPHEHRPGPGPALSFLHPPSNPRRPSLAAEITADQKERRRGPFRPLSFSLPAVGPWQGSFSELQFPNPQKWSDNTHALETASVIQMGCIIFMAHSHPPVLVEE